MKLALALVLFAACGKHDAPAAQVSPPPVASPPSVPEPTQVVMSPDVIPPESRELVTAVIPTWDATTAELRFYTRASATAPWQLAQGPWPGVIGNTGAGWGIGRHGRGPASGRSGPLKAEGDGRSPAGAFLLTASFGYAPSPPPKAALPYHQTDDNWKCVDDPKSARYNVILDKRNVPVDWKSAEEMHRPDALYTWVVEVAHNPTRLPNGGSCIFLHVWAGPDSTTVGCTAMEEPRLAGLLAALSDDARPMFVLLPRAEYDALAKPWGLPAL